MENNKTANIKDRKKHPHAIIINLSGHILPQSVFDELKLQGHQSFSVITQSVHIDVDESIHEQCKKIIDTVLSMKTRRSKTLLELEGESYYVSAGHTHANLVIYSGIAALLGYNPHVIITGINRFRFQDHECKSIFNLQSWVGRWRSIERNKYSQAIQEVA